jgi:hypothetical protein
VGKCPRGADHVRSVTSSVESPETSDRSSMIMCGFVRPPRRESTLSTIALRSHCAASAGHEDRRVPSVWAHRLPLRTKLRGSGWFGAVVARHHHRNPWSFGCGCCGRLNSPLRCHFPKCRVA